MLEPVPLKPRSLDRYMQVMTPAARERIETLAESLHNKRVLQINATAYGGGVAEILTTLIPMMRGIGVDAQWEVMYGTDDFYNVTKAIHNSLQGMETAWTPQMEEIYYDQQIANIERLEAEEYDFVVVHDPQPAAFLDQYIKKHGHRPPGKWIWRCHIDTSRPFAPVADYVFPFIESYDAAVFTMQDFIPTGRPLPPISLIPPCIDPISLKNLSLGDEVNHAIVDSYGIDPNRPFLVQISRFDPWKDPLGVIDAYRIVKKEIPEIQLVLAGSMASDDPEGMHYLARTETHAQDDPDIFILTNAHGVGAIEVNAFQRAAAVVIQKSTREGFGLTVSEAMWKQTPVIGGNVGGIRLQIEHEKTGYLVDDVDACAKHCIDLLKNLDQCKKMGELAHNHVRENFTMTALLENWLQLFVSLQD